jgi:hypothetical protein
MEGNLSDFSLDELIALLGKQKKSGALSLEGKEAKAEVVFDDGWITLVSLKPNPVPLGVRIMRAGIVEREVIDELLEDQILGAEKKPLGEILVEGGYIQPEDLRRLLKEHVLETLFVISRWKDAFFKFEEKKLALKVDKLVGWEEALEELKKRANEWDKLRDIFASFDLRARARDLSMSVEEVRLSPLEFNLLKYLDGSRTVYDLARLMNCTEFEVCRLLNELLKRSLVEVEGEGLL